RTENPRVAGSIPALGMNSLSDILMGMFFIENLWDFINIGCEKGALLYEKICFICIALAIAILL
ncbi:MAG: hypothetical protein IJN92_00935, partial [Lachnospiraceae bacterium]|nr:hypothetical protein [Lachnospiraceae bacterium]